jgi:retinal rod rhodopsin-sensitive cGMP 3',5'-cyclic phosphodiesterase subunit delta
MSSDSIQLLRIAIKDAYTNEVFFDCDGREFETNQVARISRNIFNAEEIKREIEFSADIEIKDFKIQQELVLRDKLIEKWEFKFGFVMPNSINTWQQTITPSKSPIPIKTLSGNLKILTKFFDGKKLIKEIYATIYYD